MKILKNLFKPQKLKQIYGVYTLKLSKPFMEVGKHLSPYFVKAEDGFLVKWKYDFRRFGKRFHKAGFDTPAEALRAQKLAYYQAKEQQVARIERIQKENALLLGKSPKKGFFDNI